MDGLPFVGMKLMDEVSWGPLCWCHFIILLHKALFSSKGENRMGLVGEHGETATFPGDEGELYQLRNRRTLFLDVTRKNMASFLRYSCQMHGLSESQKKTRSAECKACTL